METVNDVLAYLDKIAPVKTKMDFDNVGLLVGRTGDAVSKIMLALDITSEVISEALDTGAQLIVAHHPMFFSLKSITDTDTTGSKIIRMLAGGLSAICMHTNLDAARGGVNDALAVAAGILRDSDGTAELLAEDGFSPDGEAFSYGRFGRLKDPLLLSEYMAVLKAALNTNGIRYYDAGKDVYEIAIVGGSGGDQFDHAVAKGCDTFISADIKYDLFLEAKELGINVIDGDHFCTENIVIAPLAEKLRGAFPDLSIEISQSHKQVAKFF